MKYEIIEETGSTNSYVREHAGVSVPPMCMVIARRQTAGRGQRGNTWESQPGKNLTFSFYVDNPPVAPAAQFAISEAVALAIVGLLRGYGIDARVKWPNDIYAGARKICGILIENSITGSSLSRSIIGAGLNVNQTLFESDAPNPVSMLQLKPGVEFPLEKVASALCAELERNIGRLAEPESLHSEYMNNLYRGDGLLHPYEDAATGERFEARIEGVEPSGHLTLSDSLGQTRRYAFKEVRFL